MTTFEILTLFLLGLIVIFQIFLVLILRDRLTDLLYLLKDFRGSLSDIRDQYRRMIDRDYEFYGRVSAELGRRINEALEPLVRRLGETFSPGYWWRSRSAPALLETFISRAEREFGVRLSLAARDMLTVPIGELVERGDSVDFDSVRESITMLVGTIAESPSARARGDSIAVIEAFAKRFCGIPPFCDRKD